MLQPTMQRINYGKIINDLKVSWSLSLVQTVKESENYFTKRQIEQAKQARKLYHSLGVPSMQDFKALNVIKNNPVTIEYIDNCEKILMIVFCYTKLHQILVLEPCYMQLISLYLLLTLMVP